MGLYGSNSTFSRSARAAVVGLLLIATTPGLTAPTMAAGPSSPVINTILSGSGKPSSAVGKNGDFYIDISVMNMFGPKSQGKWPSAFSLRGSDGKSLPGDSGVTGRPGVAGATGATGATGSTGAVGNTGPQGPTGNTGDKGPSGLAGSAGPIGLTGASGAAGPIGLTGASGAAGSPGSQGAAGLAGSQGATGAAGLAGSQGATGSSGILEATFGTLTLSLISASANGVGLNSVPILIGPGKRFMIDLHLHAAPNFSTAPTIKLEMTFGSNCILSTSMLAWNLTSGASLRSGSNSPTEYGISAKAVVDASNCTSSTAVTFSVTVLENTISRPVSFVGEYFAQPVQVLINTNA